MDFWIPFIIVITIANLTVYLHAAAIKDNDSAILGCSQEQYVTCAGQCDQEKCREMKENCRQVKQQLTKDINPQHLQAGETSEEQGNSGECFADIMISPEQLKGYLEANENKKRKKRKIRSDFLLTKWPTEEHNNTIYYKFFSNVPGALKRETRAALQLWADNTCLQFEEIDLQASSGDAPNILFYNFPSTCSSYIGRVGRLTTQPIFISSFCHKIVIAHEIAHTLGVIHEHQRPDRDSYVTINPNNIMQGYDSYFATFRPSVITTMQIQYDYASVMHYFGTAFSTGLNRKTIVTKDPKYQSVIGQRVELSFLDVLLINSVYCKNTCANSYFTCKNNGYPDPNDCTRCRCPDGFTGQRCGWTQGPSNSLNAQRVPSCGNNVVTATKQRKTFTSPNYNDQQHYSSGDECTWLIQANNGDKVQMRFVEEFSVYKGSDACHHWVEVLHESVDRTFAMGGPRYCGMSTPSDVIVSTENRILVLFRAKYNNHKNSFRGFKIEYWSDGDDCSSGPCQNGGTCETKSTGYFCNCLSGYMGENCENYDFTFNNNIDLVFMLDSTYHSFKDFYYYKEISRRLQLYTSLHSSSHEVRHGLITFYDKPKTEMVISQILNVETFDNVVSSLSHTNYGGTDIFGAFNHLVQDFLSSIQTSDNQFVPKVALTLIDSHHSRWSSQSMIEETRNKLRDNCIQVVVVIVHIHSELIRYILPSPQHIINTSEQENLVNPQFIHSVMQHLIAAATESRNCLLQKPPSTSTTSTTTTKAPTTVAATTIPSLSPSTTTISTSTLPTTTKTIITTTTKPAASTIYTTKPTSKITTKPTTRSTATASSLSSLSSTISSTARSDSKEHVVSDNNSKEKEQPSSSKEEDKTTDNTVYCNTETSECDHDCGGCGYKNVTVKCMKNNLVVSVEEYRQPCNDNPCVKTCHVWIGALYERECKFCCPGFIEIGDICHMEDNRQGNNG